MAVYRTLSAEQVKLGFVASCVEFVATALNLPVERCYARMKDAHLLDEYLYRNYEAVHSQSREHVTEDLIHLLNRAEKGSRNISRTCRFVCAIRRSSTDCSISRGLSMSPEPRENADIDNILMGGKIGIIAAELARRLKIDGVSALMLFYESETCRRLHDKRTGLYLLSELYIVDDVMAELEANQARIRAGIEQLERGEGHEHELIEV